MDLKKRIDLLKERLNKLILINDNHLTSKEIVKLSQELDLLIKEYYK